MEKGGAFSRPVLVFKKLSKEGFIGVPFSTKKKVGSWYVNLKFKNNIANISQVRLMSSARMYEKMGTLEEEDFKKVKNGFLHLYS
jgi:mRNA interferase MazF